MTFIQEYPGKVLELSFQLSVRILEKNVWKGGPIRATRSATVFRYWQKKMVWSKCPPPQGKGED